VGVTSGVQESRCDKKDNCETNLFTEEQGGKERERMGEFEEAWEYITNSEREFMI
jgi:hypothetical protein